MLDEVVSDINTAPTPLDAPAPEIKVHPADAIFGPFRFKDTEKVIPGADTPSTTPDAAAPEIKVQPADAIFGPFRGKVADTTSMPPDATAPEIKVHPVDGIRGHAPLDDTEGASTRQGPSFFTRLRRYSARAAAVAGF